MKEMTMTLKELKNNKEYATEFFNRETKEREGYIFNDINYTYGVWFKDNTVVRELLPREMRELTKNYKINGYATFFA